MDKMNGEGDSMLKLLRSLPLTRPNRFGGGEIAKDFLGKRRKRGGIHNHSNDLEKKIKKKKKTKKKKKKRNPQLPP